jgi:predicted transcriptional regulator
MKTVTFKVETSQDAFAAMSASIAKGKPLAPAVSFATWELMNRILTPKRIAIIKALCGQQPLAIREIARRVERDYKGVHSDITALVKAGVVATTPQGVSFPYDRIHVEFDIQTAA